MEPEVKRDTSSTGKDSPSPQPPLSSLSADSQCAVKLTGPEFNSTDKSREAGKVFPKSARAKNRRLDDEARNQEREEERLVLKMNDGRTVACQFVRDGKEQYLKEIPPGEGGASQRVPDMSSSSDGKQNSFSRSSQFVSSVNLLLEESSSKEDPGAERFRRSTLELFEPIPSRLLKNQPSSQQWTEQGRRLATFVEDSIYRSLKSNDADVVKEWQLKMSSEAIHGRLSDEARGGEDRPDEKAAGDDAGGAGPRYQTPCPSEGEHSRVPPRDIAEGSSSSSSSLGKNGKISLLDVLRAKLRTTLLNYDQQIKQDSQSVTRSIDTLFFSPAVESTTPDSQSAMPSSSDDVFRVDDPPDGYCGADSGSSSSADDSCSDGPSSTQSMVCPTSSSSSKLESGAYDGDGSASEAALDLSCGPQKGKGPDPEKRKRTSPSDFSLEGILARPDPKPKQKHNPFMQTFSDLLDLPPREIKNRDPFKVKRRPYRRRRGMHHGQYGKHDDDPEGSGENGMGSTSSEGGTPKPLPHANPQAPIGYLAITEDEYQRSLANASGSPDADWPSVALLMNVYSEWKLKNRGITPASHLSGELGARGLPVPAAGLAKSSQLPASTSPPSTQRESPPSENAPHRTSCSSDCSSRSAGHVHSKKSRLLQNVERSCSCKSHSRKAGHPGNDEGAKSSIRSLLDEERMEKKRRRRVEPSDSEKQDSDSEEAVKRTRVAAYRDDGEVALRRDPDGQGVCVIS